MLSECVIIIIIIIVLLITAIIWFTRKDHPKNIKGGIHMNGGELTEADVSTFYEANRCVLDPRCDDTAANQYINLFMGTMVPGLPVTARYGLLNRFVGDAINDQTNPVFMQTAVCAFSAMLRDEEITQFLMTYTDGLPLDSYAADFSIGPFIPFIIKHTVYRTIRDPGVCFTYYTTHVQSTNDIIRINTYWEAFGDGLQTSRAYNTEINTVAYLDPVIALINASSSLNEMSCICNNALCILVPMVPSKLQVTVFTDIIRKAIAVCSTVFGEVYETSIQEFQIFMDSAMNLGPRIIDADDDLKVPIGAALIEFYNAYIQILSREAIYFAGVAPIVNAINYVFGEIEID